MTIQPEAFLKHGHCVTVFIWMNWTSLESRLPDFYRAYAHHLHKSPMTSIRQLEGLQAAVLNSRARRGTFSSVTHHKSANPCASPPWQRWEDGAQLRLCEASFTNARKALWDPRMEDADYENAILLTEREVGKSIWTFTERGILCSQATFHSLGRYFRVTILQHEREIWKPLKTGLNFT